MILTWSSCCVWPNQWPNRTCLMMFAMGMMTCPQVKKKFINNCFEWISIKLGQTTLTVHSVIGGSVRKHKVGDHELIQRSSVRSQWSHPFMSPQVIRSWNSVRNSTRRIISSAEPGHQLTQFHILEIGIFRSVVLPRIIRAVFSSIVFRRVAGKSFEKVHFNKRCTDVWSQNQESNHD